MEQTDWKEKTRVFFKAKVLEEYKNVVGRENIRKIHFLNLGMVFYALILCGYIRYENSGDGCYPYICAVSIFLTAGMFLFMWFLAKSKRVSYFPLLVLEYIALAACFAVYDTLQPPGLSMMAYLIFLLLPVYLLMKPVHMLLLQVLAALMFVGLNRFSGSPQYMDIGTGNIILATVCGMILGCIVLYFRVDSMQKLQERERALKLSALYQSIVDETQTGVYVRDMNTHEMLYLNRKAREVFKVNGPVEGENCYRIVCHREDPCETCPAGKLHRDGFSSREVLLGGHCYETKGKIIDWCGREAYVEYLIDVTDSRHTQEQLKAAHDTLQKKYHEELLYREKAVSEDVISTSKLNLTRGIVEEMRVGGKEGYEEVYRYTTDFSKRMEAFAKELWITEEQNRRFSVDGLLEMYEEGKTSIAEEYIARLHNDKYVWVRVEINMLRRPETSEIMAFIYNRDITREKKLSHLLERIMLFEYDEIYTIDSFAQTFVAEAVGQYAMDEQMARGSYAEELEWLVSRAPLEADKEKIKNELSIGEMKRFLEDSSTHQVEVSLMSKNGKVRRKQIRCMYLNEEIGILLMTLTDIEDVVQEEKIKQEQLEQALKMANEANAAKSNFLASMSHEIRTPMNAIIGLNSIIKDEIDNKEQVLDCTEKLDSSSRYLLSLLNDILDMSKIESGNMELLHQPFDGDKFWDNVNILGRTQANMASVHYVFERSEEVSRIYIGDAVRLQQIMINLINNAIKFTSTDGYVRVSVLETEEPDNKASILVLVEDNGIGMSKEFLPEVFDTFTQEHAGTTTSYKGSGLGLSIARNFARMMDGDITVESTEGVGTTFFVRVMLDIDKESKPVQDAKKLPGTMDFTGKRVLLVEDHPLNTMVAERMLTKRGFLVDHAENGVEAVSRFSESALGTYDVILMDIRMPVMDGIEATKKIRSLDREDAAAIPIIAMTANAYDEDCRMTAEAGMNAHLAKPIDPQQLFETLKNFMQNPVLP